MADRMAKKGASIKIIAASIALCAMLAVWLLKQPSQIAYEKVLKLSSMFLFFATYKFEKRSWFIILMYLGRVGGLTLIFATISRQSNTARLPQEKLTVG